jgi:hypothetical protein
VKLLFPKFKSSMFWHILISIVIMLGLNITILIELSKYLLVPQPLPIIYNAPRKPLITLTRPKSQNGLSMNWIDVLATKEKPLIVLYENDELSNEEIDIKKQIAFLKLTLKSQEKYKVNNQLQRHFVGNTNLPDGLVIKLKKRRNNY